MKSTLLRLLSGAVGLFAALVAIVGPVLFIASERQEAKSAYQYNGHASFWGAVGGYATVLFLVLFCVFIAYFSLRFSFKGPKSDRLPPPNALSGQSGR
jgi:uncharacterized membrane protein